MGRHLRDDEDAPVMVYGTFPDRDTALSIAGELVDGKLAACVNVLGEITSIYNWNGARQTDTEVSALIKTRRGLAGDVIARVKALHPYDNPALLVVPVTGGTDAFVNWIMAETARAGTSNTPGG